MKEERKVKLIPVENIPDRKYKTQKNMNIVREFMDSQVRCELVEGNGKRAYRLISRRS